VHVDQESHPLAVRKADWHATGTEALVNVLSEALDAAADHRINLGTETEITTVWLNECDEVKLRIQKKIVAILVTYLHHGYRTYSMRYSSIYYRFDASRQ